MPDDPTDTGRPGLGCHLFVSYASDDRDIVLKLRDRLLDRGAASVWVDKPEIDPGDEWQKEIRKGLRKTQLTLAVLTKRSIDPQRRWIVYEHEQSARLFRPIIPLRFDDSEPPEHLEQLEYADFRDDWEHGFRSVLNAIGKHTRRGGRQFADESPSLRQTFVGRENQVRDIVDLLIVEAGDVDTAKQSVAIQGMGGMGKSMLAAEVVRRLGPLYPGGVLHVDRGKGAEKPQVVLQRWIERADGRHSENDTRREIRPAEVRDRLRRYGALLVLLDDVGEAGFEAAGTLLDALPPDAARLLTTRSTKIRRDLGAKLYRLGRLSDEDALSLLHDRLEHLGKAPDETLLQQLVEQVDGHPLSLELITARCDRRSDLPHLVDELEDILGAGALGLEALEIEEEEEKDKYRSVAASLALSFAGLERIDAKNKSALARRFLALGIFPGGGLIDEAMAAAAWNVDPSDKTAMRQTRRALNVFIRRAMLSVDPETELYLLHPLMRAFAYNQLRQNGKRFPRIRARYIRHVIEVSRTIYRQQPEEWKQHEHLERHLQYVGEGLVRGVPKKLGAELETLAAPRGEDPSKQEVTEEIEEELHLGSDFAHAVRELVVRRPELGLQGRDWLQVGLACARALQQSLRTVRYLRELGRWHLRRDPKRAQEYLAEAVRQAHEERERKEFLQQEAIALSYRGEALRVLSRPREAITCLQDALEIHRRFDDQFMIATSLKYLGETYWRQGRLGRARKSYDEAQRIFQAKELRAQQGDMLNKMGSLYFNAGQQEKAIPEFRKALEIHREVGNPAMETEDLNDMGISYKYLGRLDEAEPPLRRALEIARDIGYGRLESITLNNLAQLYNEREEYEKSREMAQLALSRAVEVEDRVSEAWALNWLGLVHQHAAEHAEAEQCFRRALRLCSGTENPRGEAALCANLGWLQIAHLGQTEAGVAQLKAAIQLLENQGLEQAYGGRRIEDLRELLAKVPPA